MITTTFTYENKNYTAYRIGNYVAIDVPTEWVHRSYRENSFTPTYITWDTNYAVGELILDTIHNLSNGCVVEVYQVSFTWETKTDKITQYPEFPTQINYYIRYSNSTKTHIVREGAYDRYASGLTLYTVKERIPPYQPSPATKTQLAAMKARRVKRPKASVEELLKAWGIKVVGEAVYDRGYSVDGKRRIPGDVIKDERTGDCYYLFRTGTTKTNDKPLVDIDDKYDYGNILELLIKQGELSPDATAQIIHETKLTHNNQEEEVTYLRVSDNAGTANIRLYPIYHRRISRIKITE